MTEKTTPYPIAPTDFEDWMDDMYATAWAIPDPVVRATWLAELDNPATQRLLFLAFTAGAREGRLRAMDEAFEATHDGSCGRRHPLSLVSRLRSRERQRYQAERATPPLEPQVETLQ